MHLHSSSRCNLLYRFYMTYLGLLLRFTARFFQTDLTLTDSASDECETRRNVKIGATRGARMECAHARATKLFVSRQILKDFFLEKKGSSTRKSGNDDEVPPFSTVERKKTASGEILLAAGLGRLQRPPQPPRPPVRH
jgi:hypothetical protein